MRQALAEARRAFDLGEVPIGAVVVWGDRIVGRGHNLVETLNDPTAHAEMQAITAATASVGGKYLSECRLYVTVEPCVMCAGACYWSQVGSVIYGAADPKRGVSTVSQAVFHPKTTVRGGDTRSRMRGVGQQLFSKIEEITRPWKPAEDSGSVQEQPGKLPCKFKSRGTATRSGLFGKAAAVRFGLA